VNKKNGHPPTHYPSPKRKKKRKKEKKKDQNHSEVEEGDFVRKKIKWKSILWSCNACVLKNSSHL